MIQERYAIEGQRMYTARNIELTSTPEGLERAMMHDEILEATALVCSSDMSITVDLGSMRGVIPKSEATLPGENSEIKDIAVITRVGKPVCFKVLSITKDSDGNPYAILSRRAAQLECLRNYIMKLTPGDIIPARITHMEHFGAFVDVGCGVVSLLSIDSISVSRISHPADRFEVGEVISAVVKSLDRDTGRMYVTHKELLGTWSENASDFSIGTTVTGIVRSIESYGIFVELAPNLAGLAEYTDNVAVGSGASVYIKNILPEKMKIKLVLIDTFPLPPKMTRRYYIDPRVCDRIEYWRYSPAVCSKIVESNFGMTYINNEENTGN